MQFGDIMSCVACEKQQQQQQPHQNQHNFNNRKQTGSNSSQQLLKLKKDYEKFFQKYQSISVSSNLNNLVNHPIIEAKPDELINTIGQLISCIGCRTSVERFYKQLVAKQQNHSVSLTLSSSANSKRTQKLTNFALDPLLINQNGNLTLKKSLMLNPMLIFKLLYING
jgi:hypothetical protein